MSTKKKVKKTEVTINGQVKEEVSKKVVKPTKKAAKAKPGVEEPKKAKVVKSEEKSQSEVKTIIDSIYSERNKPIEVKPVEVKSECGCDCECKKQEETTKNIVITSTPTTDWFAKYATPKKETFWDKVKKFFKK